MVIQRKSKTKTSSTVKGRKKEREREKERNKEERRKERRKEGRKEKILAKYSCYQAQMTSIYLNSIDLSSLNPSWCQIVVRRFRGLPKHIDERKNKQVVASE
jgi:hypothetical protein